MSSELQSNGELSAAQKLMQKHEVDVEHKVSVEDVPDEDDLKHGEPPVSASVLEAADGSEEVPVKLPPKQKAAPLDTQSHELFPELGAAPPKARSNAPSVWAAKQSGPSKGINGTKDSSVDPVPANGINGTKGSSADPGPAIPIISNGGPRVPNMPGRHMDHIVMEPKHILPRQQLKKPVADVLRDINKKSKAHVTLNTSAQGTQFTATGPTESSCRDALNAIAEAIGQKETITVQIPRSVRGYIVGKGGSNIKDLQERTGARIHMPKNDNGPVNGADDDDDATIDVKIEGNHISAGMAQRLILKAAEERTPSSTHKLRDIPAEFFPFIAGPRKERINALEEGKELRINVPAYHTWDRQAPPGAPASGQLPQFLPAPNGNHIVLTGSRAAIQEARSQIEKHVQELRQQLTTTSIRLDKPQHQFIIGDLGIPAEDFLAETGCAVILPSDPQIEAITIVGPADRLSVGTDKAEELATSRSMMNVDIARIHPKAPNGAAVHAQNLTRYLQRRKEIERLEQLYEAHINVAPVTDGRPWELYTPHGKLGNRAKNEITNIVNGHPPSKMINFEVDPFFHQHLRAEVAHKVQEQYGVLLVVPDETDSSQQILLVFEGPAGNEPAYKVTQTQPSAAEIQAFQRGLEDARKHILNIVSSQQQISSKKLEVPKKFQDKLRKFYKQYQQNLSADQIPVQIKAIETTITLQGPSSEVETLAQQMNEYLEQVAEEEKERGFTLTFDFPQKHANQLIGKGGSKISELREKFDVDIQVKDGTVELKGPKAKAEAAKSHITQLGKAWADEVHYVLKVEPKYHRELIGAQGAQIKKLEKRYSVDIHFPKTARINDTQSNADAASESGRRPRQTQAEDEVSVRGPKKGADEARDEILSLLQYLKDNSNIATVSVQQSQIPSLIGQRGSGMDEIRQLTGARIDVPNARDSKDPTGLVEIQIKGGKSQVAQAKKIIEEKKAIFDDTVVKTIDIDRKHHSALIGTGGANLRDIVTKAGGSSERRELAKTVQFPRAGTDSNTIKIEGSKAVVDKIIAAMNEIVGQRENQVTEMVPVPISQHRSLIGRGGDAKREMESKFNVSIDIPRQGSGLTDVKIAGQPKDVESAKEHILSLVKDQAGETIQVPRSLHSAISDNGQFFRKLRSNYQVTVDHDNHKIPSPAPAPKGAKINGGSLPLITDDQEAAADKHIWEVVSSGATGPDMEGDIPWVLRGSQENVNKAKSLVASAIEQAQKNTHTGYLVLPDPSKYRYVIGQGGNKVNSIRKQSGCRINVPKAGSGDQAIEISGSAEGVEKAKEMVLEAVREGGNANGGNRS